MKLSELKDALNVLYVCYIDCDKVSDQDKTRLFQLSFYPSEEIEDSYYSFRFGSFHRPAANWRLLTFWENVV